MFNKLELEQTLWSGLSAVWEPLPILVRFSFAGTVPLCLSIFLHPRPQPPLSALMCLTGFPGFHKVCGKCEILSKEMLACSHH